MSSGRLRRWRERDQGSAYVFVETSVTPTLTSIAVTPASADDRGRRRPADDWPPAPTRTPPPQNLTSTVTWASLADGRDDLHGRARPRRGRGHEHDLGHAGLSSAPRRSRSPRPRSSRSRSPRHPDDRGRRRTSRCRRPAPTRTPPPRTSPRRSPGPRARHGRDDLHGRARPRRGRGHEHDHGRPSGLIIRLDHCSRSPPPTLVSIAVTPATPTIAAGADQQMTGHRHLLGRLHRRT